MARGSESVHTDGGRLVADGGERALDCVFEGLSRAHDRYVLYHLLENDPVEFDELVDAVTALETGEAAAEAPDDVREEIRTKLHHVRLPKLDDLGIIEYDYRSGAVRYRNPPPHLEDLLHVTRGLEKH